MSDTGDLIDLDHAVRTGWEQLRADLVGYVDRMPDGAVLTARALVGEEPVGGCAPWVRVQRHGPLVFVTAPSNAHLAPAHRLDEAAERWMTEHGWDDVFAHLAAPGGLDLGDHFADVGSRVQARAPDRLAGQVVDALREAYGVVHPAMLLVRGERDEGAWRAVGRIVPEGAGGAGSAPVHPGTASGLTAEVGAALARHQGAPVEPDATGGYAVPVAGTRFRVRARGDASVVEVDGALVVDVVDVRAARAWLPRLNMTSPWGELYLDGSQVRLRANLLAAPFVPEHLARGLALLERQVEVAAPKLVARAGGRRSRLP